MIRSQDSGCRYEFDGAIHRFTIVKATLTAVDEFLIHLQHILTETAPDEPVRILMDLRPDGLPPIAPMLMRFKTFFGQQSRPRTFKSAYLYRRGTLIHILPTLLNMIRQRATRRFFMDGQEDEAINWLMEEEIKTRG
jgi:hypothetical protein